MSGDCVACGGITAWLAYGAEHDLATLLCLEHLVAALEVPTGKAPDIVRCRGVRDRTCSGARGTCPAPVVDVRVNASWCAAHRPAPTPVPGLARAGTVNVPDPAVAILEAAGWVTLYETHTYGTFLEEA